MADALATEGNSMHDSADAVLEQTTSKYENYEFPITELPHEIPPFVKLSWMFYGVIFENHLGRKLPFSAKLWRAVAIWAIVMMGTPFCYLTYRVFSVSTTVSWIGTMILMSSFVTFFVTASWSATSTAAVDLFKTKERAVRGSQKAGILTFGTWIFAFVVTLGVFREVYLELGGNYGYLVVVAAASNASFVAWFEGTVSYINRIAAREIKRKIDRHVDEIVQILSFDNNDDEDTIRKNMDTITELQTQMKNYMERVNERTSPYVLMGNITMLSFMGNWIYLTYYTVENADDTGPVPLQSRIIVCVTSVIMMFYFWVRNFSSLTAPATAHDSMLEKLNDANVLRTALNHFHKSEANLSSWVFRQKIGFKIYGSNVRIDTTILRLGVTTTFALTSTAMSFALRHV